MGALQSALTTERRLRRVDLENIPPARASLVVEAVLTEKKCGKDGAEDNNGANDSAPVLSKEQLLRIQIKLPAITEQRVSRTQTHLVLVVDKSGSMSGNPWTQVQASVKDIIGRSVKQSSVKTDLILYNDKAHVIEFTADNYEKVIADLKAGGMTSFNAAFTKVNRVITEAAHVIEFTADNYEEVITDLKAGGMISFNAAFTKVNRVITEAGGDYSRTVIVFMTDGADTVSPKEMLPKMAGTLANRWQEINKEVTIHAVGFTSSHDFKFLKNLAENGGTTPGMFRYCEPGEDKQALKHKLDELFDFILDYDDDDIKIGMSMERNDSNYFLGADNPGPTTVVQGKITPQPAKESGNGDIMVEGEAWVQLPDPYSMPEIVVNVTATVSLEEGKVPVTLPCVVEKTDFQVLDEADEKVCWRLKILNRNVDMFIDKVGKTISENGDASSFQERIEKFQKQISHTRVFGNGITRERRDELFEMIQEIQKSLDEVQNMLAQYVRGGTQSISLLARAHDMRYQAVFSKSRRQRIMDKRAAKNIVQAASAQESLSSLIVNKEEVDKLSQDAVDFYFCMLSQNTIQDILLGEDNDDTIGFGLAVKRNEVVLDEPTLIQIWVISGTLVSRTAMLDALEHKINVSSHLSAHGGFDFANTQLGVTTVGTSREPINAWLPLYVTKSHWDRVKVILKPALGSFCTLDPLGYDYKQMDVMFMTLGSMIGQLKKGAVGEHQLKLLFALLRTCAACLEDFEMTDTVVEFVEKFVSSPAGRTKDVIPNLFTLIGYIVSLPTERTRKLFCMEGDAKSKLPKLWLGFIAECLRRAAGNLYRDSSKNKLNGLIDAILHGTGQGILASSQEPAEVAVCGAAAEITRLCLQSDTEEVEVASFDPANDVKVPEMEVCHSEKVDRAMETWAEREAGFISNKAQKKQVSDAKKVVLKWVKEGHDALGIETTESDQSNKNTGTDNKSKNNTVKSTSSNKDDAKASTSKADNEEITNSEEEGSKEERHFGSDYDPNYVTSSMLNILVQLHNKLCKVAYPTMQSLPGCIAFVNAWLSKNRNLSDIDNNSGLVPEEWINEIKEAITNMSTNIDDFTARSLICVEVSDAMATTTTVQDSSDLNNTQTVNGEQDAVNRLQEAGNQEVLVVPDEQLSGNQQVQTGRLQEAGNQEVLVVPDEQLSGNQQVQTGRLQEAGNQEVLVVPDEQLSGNQQVQTGRLQEAGNQEVLVVPDEQLSGNQQVQTGRLQEAGNQEVLVVPDEQLSGNQQVQTGRLQEAGNQEVLVVPDEQLSGNQQLQTGRLQEAGNQEVLVVPDEQLAGNQQVQTGVTNTVKDNEQVYGDANVDNEDDDSDDSFEEFMDDDSDDETASEARRTMRKKQKKTKKDDKKITVPMILHFIDSDLDITLLLRALVCQAVRFHSNSAARSAITTGQLVDLGEGASCASSTLKLCHQGLQEHRDTVRKGMLDQALWKRANYCMVHSSTVWAFIGYLMNTHKDRGEGFKDLIDLFVATSQTGSIPYLEKKVHVLLTGSYKDCTVFANGNQWLPEKKMAAIFKTLLGEEKWLDFETELRSAVQIHVYRESDIPNRHGHCNSNPYIPNALRLKLGMALLPEKKGGATGNRKKLKNSKTR